jgi:predicted dehydrogenase
MCEKPLATTAADAAAISELVRKHGAPITSGYVQPFSAANRGAAKVLADGALGKVTHANFRNGHNAAYGGWFDSPELAWFAEPELSGGGALMDMGTHALHLLLHLFGPAEEVWAMTANVSGNYEKVDDYGLIEIRFASGVVGRVEAGWIFTGGHGGLEIIGSEKSLWSQAGGLVVGAPGSKPEAVAPADARPTRVDRLIAMIKGEVAAEELQEDFQACLRAVTTMSAAYESAGTGRWSKVAELPG